MSCVFPLAKQQDSYVSRHSNIPSIPVSIRFPLDDSDEDDSENIDRILADGYMSDYYGSVSDFSTSGDPYPCNW